MNASSDRRWAYLVPLATAVGAAAALAATVDGRPARADLGRPVVGPLAALAHGVGGAAGAQALAIALVVGAAVVVGQLVAAARPGWAGRLAGAVAAGWLVACPGTRGLAAAPTAATVTLLALAATVAALDRVARGGGGVAGRALAVAAVIAVELDARAWPLAALGATLILYRARRGARWPAGAAIAAVATAAVTLIPAAIAGGPRAPAAPRLAVDLAPIVDGLGPLVLALAVAGAATALGTRGDRWLAAALGATLVAAAPAVAPLPPGLVIVVAIAAGLAVASFLGRAPAPRHQVVAAGAVLALLTGALWLA